LDQARNAAKRGTANLTMTVPAANALDLCFPTLAVGDIVKQKSTGAIGRVTEATTLKTTLTVTSETFTMGDEVKIGNLVIGKIAVTHTGTTPVMNVTRGLSLADLTIGDVTIGGSANTTTGNYAVNAGTSVTLKLSQAGKALFVATTANAATDGLFYSKPSGFDSKATFMVADIDDDATLD
jgi:hypothetical protein